MNYYVSYCILLLQLCCDHYCHVHHTRVTKHCFITSLNRNNSIQELFIEGSTNYHLENMNKTENESTQGNLALFKYNYFIRYKESLCYSIYDIF